MTGTVKVTSKMKATLVTCVFLLGVIASAMIGGCKSDPPEQKGPAVGTTTPGGGVITSEGRAAKGKMPHQTPAKP